MSRPKKCRWVEKEPGINFFKPQGVPLKGLEHVTVTVDELEAVRLSDFLDMSHEAAAQQMKVSRPTITRMLARAHRTIADALVNGKAIRIEGGDYILETCHKCCAECGEPLESGQVPPPEVCQECGVKHDTETSGPGGGKGDKPCAGK